MTTRRLGRSAGAAAVLAMLVAGCGGSDGGIAAVDGTASASSQSPSPNTPPGTPPAPSGAPSSGSPSPPATSRTVEAAIQRYEHYLHALGRGDIPALCEVAGPGAKKAERDGFGPCEQTFPIMVAMMSPAQRTALQGATVDAARVVVRAPGRVEVPARAVLASATFTSGNLGDSVLEYLDGAWYVVD